jgi:hypothetical protein
VLSVTNIVPSIARSSIDLLFNCLLFSPLIPFLGLVRPFVLSQMLEWPMKRAVEFYYCVWKFSPTYQLWKSARREIKNLGTSMDLAGSSALSGSAGLPGSSSSSAGAVGAPSRAASSSAGAAGFMFRGPRMRSTKRQNYKL